MKKSLLLSALIAGVLAVAHPAPAQTVLMSQDFNSDWSTTNPPPGWRIYFDEGDTSTNDWHRGPDSGLNRWPGHPTPYALLDSFPSELGEDSLISPLVNCTGCNVIVLRCSTFFKGRAAPYTAKLLGAVDGGPFDHPIYAYVGLVGPALQEFDLSWAVGHSQVQVAWYFSGPSDLISHWAVDDVSIVGDTVTDDVGCVAILAPIGTVDSNVMVTPRAIFKNYSPGPVTFPVKMAISYSYIATDTVHDLASGDSTTVDFAPWSAAPRGAVPVEAMSTLLGDIDPSNDTVKASVAVRVRDVGCVAITAPRDTIDSGLPVQPIAHVRNFGTDTASFYAYFRIGTWVDSALVDGFIPGDERDVPFPDNWPANASGWTTARCSTAWSPDPYARNDTAGARFFVRPPHFKDVAAVQVLRPPAIVGEGSQITPSGSIQSYCDDPQTVTAYFTICNGTSAVYAESVSQPIQPGEGLVVDFPAWTADPLGTYTDTLRVRLDGDANPENDTVNSQFEVEAAFHDVGVVAITSPADTVQAGTVTPGAYVKNYGMFTETFFTKFRILQGVSPVYYDSAGVTALNPGESTLVVFPAWTAVEGSYTAQCTTDVPGDASPPNDWKEKSFVAVKLPVPVGWTEVTSMPPLPSNKDIKDGGWLVHDPGLQLIFAAKGNKQSDFYAYSALEDSWRTLKAIPLGTERKPPASGACACTDGNGTLYATKGNNTLGFYRYSFEGDSWHQLKDVALGILKKKVKGGASSAFVYSGGQPWVYLLKGYKNEFYRYDTNGDSWQTLAPAPVGANAKWDKGSWLTYDGAHTLYAHKSKYHEFYAYDTDTDVWYDTLAGMPIPGANGSKKSKDGSCATWYDASIFALKGGGTQEFWRYFVAGDTWQQLDTMPLVGSSGKKKKVKAGGGIASAGGDVFYATKGNKCREFWRYRLAGHVDIREDYAACTLPAGNDRLSIAPNPATGYVTVRLPPVFAASSSIRVYDIRGSMVMERPAAASSLLLDCRGLLPGVYFVHARSPGAQATCRLVRE